MRRFFPAVFAFLALLSLGLPSRAAMVLYDGSQNTTPNQQGWIYLTQPIVGASATQAASGGVTTLNTTAATSDQAGYFSRIPGLGAHPSVPTLDRATGFTLGFDIRLPSESHAGSDRNGDTIDDRAGFSVIALGQDLRGIELGFWTDEVWAQADGTPLFTHAEGAAFDTAAMMTHYDLVIFGDQYSLYAGGTPLLSGALRNYAAFGAPYTIPSFFFLGDDTGSAQAQVEIARIELTLSPVPEPSGFVLAGIGGLAVAAMARRRGRSMRE
jgi:hypothetical protein